MWNRVKNRAILTAMFLASWLPLHSQVMYGPTVATSQQGGQILGPLPYPAQADTLVMTVTAANGVNVYSVLLQTAPTQTGPWTACITSTVTGGSVTTGTVTASCKPQGALYYRVYVQSGAPLVVNLVDSSGNAFVLSAPRGVTYDSVHNVAYISDAGNNRLLAYNLTTNVTSVVAPAGGYPTTGLSNPGQLGIFSSTDIYLADTGNNRVLDYNIAANTATLLNTVSSGFTLASPDGVCADGSNIVHIVDTNNNRVLQHNTSTHVTTLEAIGSPGGLPLSSPHGCNTNGAGTIWYADSGNNRVVLNVAGTISISGSAPYTQLGNLGVTHYNPTNQVLMADTQQSRILDLDQGSGVTSILSVYNNPGQFQLKNPNEIYVQGNAGFSQLLIADTGNNRVILSAYPNTGGYITVGVVGINSLVGHSGGGGTFVCDQAHDCAALDGTNHFPNLQTLDVSRINVMEDSTGAAGTTGQVMTNVGGVPLWQSSPGPSLLPGNPDVIYTFVANGDQSGTTVHDVSGHNNNATFGTTPPLWNGAGVDFTNNGGSFIDLPATLNSEMTICQVHYAPFWTQTGNNPPGFISILANSTGGSAQGPVWWLSQNFSTQFFGPIGTSIGEQTPHIGMHAYCAVIFQSNSQAGIGLPGDQGFIDGVLMANSNGGNSNGTLKSGHYQLGANFAGPEIGQVYYVAMWPTKLTASQIQLVSNSMLQQVAARGVQMVPNTTYQNVAGVQYLVGVGDSITNGNGVGGAQNWLAVSTPALTYTKVNFGVSGFGTSQMFGEVNWQVYPYCNVTGGKSLAIIFGGTNDGGGSTALATYNRVVAWANKVRYAGCLPGVGTMISRGAGLDTFKDAFNPLLRSGAAKGLYFLVDFASDPNMGCDGCNTNLTFFQADTVHPTVAGQALLGVAASNAINYATGASAANPTTYATNTQTLASADAYVVAIPTAAAAYTLPSCTGVVGSSYSIFNKSAGAFTITFAGGASQPIVGATTLAQNVNAVFTAQLISNTAAGCFWLRTL